MFFVIFLLLFFTFSLLLLFFGIFFVVVSLPFFVRDILTLFFTPALLFCVAINKQRIYFSVLTDYCTFHNSLIHSILLLPAKTAILIVYAVLKTVL